MKPISRASGRSAVASAAYRAAERLTNERDGITHDFTRKEGVEHAEIVLPEGVTADWARDRSALWNAAEFAEVRKDARVAREFEIALPHELSFEQRTELVRAFAQGLADRHGTAVDFALHAPHDASDLRNSHAHVMMTTRTVTADGLGEKTFLERENKWLQAQGLATTDVQLRDIRQAWESVANEHLALAGLDVRIDCRSHQERGLEIEPTEHMGVHATQMQRRGLAVDRTRLDDEAAQRNAELIAEKPEQVLSLITDEKSVFDRRDIARALHRYIDEPEAFQAALARVMASPALVTLQAERIDPETGEVSRARYSTREVVSLEADMAAGAERLGAAHGHGVDRRSVERAIERQDDALRRRAGDGSARLSEEQRRAVEHVTGAERIAVVVGFAGAGKSTMLAAAREAWEAEGYAVHGAALAGKAAEGLEESSGIASRTLASWERGWQNERHLLGRGDVLVIDEAGMVGSRQLARFVGEVEARGAKIVLVGDHEQLQAIGAGAPFRAIAEAVGHVELSDIRRQHEGWQREASVAFATHRTAEGLAAYRDHGAIRFAAGSEAARAAIVRDYIEDREARPDGSRVAMAHRRVDVRALNDDIRSALQARGALARGAEDQGALGREQTFQTNDGARSFAPGDRIVFLENDRDLGVKNGMLGTVETVEPGRMIARLDGPAALGSGEGSRAVSVSADNYNAIDHGYATTIHKTQGATVDRAYVLASPTMDRHLTYVAMTRHRESVQLHVDAGEFAGDVRAGRLVDHGRAPYEHDPANRDSYYATVENAKGERHTTWGVDLERAIAEARPAIGDTIGLEHTGSSPVRLAEGVEAERHSWKVVGSEDLAWRQMEGRLSRSGAKETTLDYPEASRQDPAERQFAERRGLAERFGIRSEIAIERREQVAPVELSRDAAEVAREVPRSAAVAAPRRGMFEGLKLKVDRGSAPEPAAASPGLRPERKAAERDRLAERVRAPSRFEEAVDRYARAHSAALGQARAGLPVLEGQTQEVRAAGEQLDQARPGARELIRSALQHDPGMVEAMTQLTGRERVGQVVASLERERAALADPMVRADRFVERWQGLEAQRRELRGWQHDAARGKVESQMLDMGKSLERDPQVDSLLRNRRRELGIGLPARESEGIAHELQQSLTRGRSLGLGM